MLAKMYWAVWALFALTIGAIYLVGAFDLTVAVVGGFISFGLVFAGMMCVLPHVVSHPSESHEEKSSQITLKAPQRSVRASEPRPQVWIPVQNIEASQHRYR